MAIIESVHHGIFTLPNEILLSIFSTFPTHALLEYSCTCRHFHALIIRILHQRLHYAAGLDGHTLYLECGPPALRYSTSKVHCVSLGTDGLEELIAGVDDADSNLGKIEKMGQLYSRFKPQRRDADLRSVPRPNRPGDIPGSRTYVSPDQVTPDLWRPEDKVTQTVSIDSHCLFAQLETVAYLGKRESTRGLLYSLQTICDGLIRVWRDWLARQCEQKRWTDGEPIEVHRDKPATSTISRDPGSGSASVTAEPKDDAMVLWTNSREPNVGIRFRVKEQKWRRDNPVLFSSDIEVPVSYIVEFDGWYSTSSETSLTADRQNRALDSDNSFTPQNRGSTKAE